MIIIIGHAITTHLHGHLTTCEELGNWSLLQPIAVFQSYMPVIHNGVGGLPDSGKKRHLSEWIHLMTIEFA